MVYLIEQVDLMTTKCSLTGNYVKMYVMFIVNLIEKIGCMGCPLTKGARHVPGLLNLD